MRRAGEARVVYTKVDLTGHDAIGHANLNRQKEGKDLGYVCVCFVCCVCVSFVAVECCLVVR